EFRRVLFRALVILGATAVAVPGEDRIDEGAVHLQRPRAALTEQPLEVAHQILDGARLDVGAPLAEHALDRLARLGELLSRDARSFGAARLGRPLRRLRRARPQIEREAEPSRRALGRRVDLDARELD